MAAVCDLRLTRNHRLISHHTLFLVQHFLQLTIRLLDLSDARFLLEAADFA